MQDSITYDIFKDDPAGTPLWVEAVSGLDSAMNRMEELAASDPCDFYLFCAQAGKIVRRLRRKASRPDDRPGNAFRQKAG